MSDELLDLDEEGIQLKDTLTNMMDSLRMILSFWIDKEAGVSSKTVLLHRNGLIFQDRSGGHGRPKFIVPLHTLQYLCDLHGLKLLASWVYQDEPCFRSAMSLVLMPLVLLLTLKCLTMK